MEELNEMEEEFVERHHCFLMSEKALAVDWLKPEEDEAWAYLQIENRGSADLFVDIFPDSPSGQKPSDR